MSCARPRGPHAQPHRSSSFHHLPCCLSSSFSEQYGVQRNRGQLKKNSGSDTTTVLKKRDVTYLAVRLKRDHPEIAAAVERGEYRSMRQAAIVAGIIKSLTPYQQILRLLPKLSPEERDQLAEMLREGA